jgi:hypothetical protein
MRNAYGKRRSNARLRVTCKAISWRTMRAARVAGTPPGIAAALAALASKEFMG